MSRLIPLGVGDFYKQSSKKPPERKSAKIGSNPLVRCLQVLLANLTFFHSHRLPIGSPIPLDIGELIELLAVVRHAETAGPIVVHRVSHQLRLFVG